MNSKVDFAAGGIVLIENKILLVKNRLSEEYVGDYDSGFWGYPKGHLDDQETPIKAAEREVYEETGFKVSAVGKKPIESFSKEPDDEIEEIAIVQFEEAYKLLAYEEDKKILKYVFNRK